MMLAVSKQVACDRDLFFLFKAQAGFLIFGGLRTQ
jgi:hypothetical protein